MNIDIGFAGASALKCLWFLLPVVAANAAPVLVKGRFKFLAIPVDFNKRLWGQPIFGNHKTIRGLLAACVVGFLVFTLQEYLYHQFWVFREISLINYSRYGLSFGLLPGFGAIMGDLIASFFKRRVGIPPGAPWVFDSFDYVFGAIVFGMVLYVPTWKTVILLLILGFFIHKALNAIYRFGMEKISKRNRNLFAD